ncbi:unnamed protein product [Paramecium octaurelia]|uniref:Uncharacterized protein n=1 Tax=Paramecium octaurelia TaxID=43137 RepID=A0A8S1YGK7_PAROT|nr:unnamed protein product [Paramecium octaurelia]
MISNQVYEIPRQPLDSQEQMCKKAMRRMIEASGWKCSEEELNKICQNDTVTIDIVTRRVRQQGINPQNPQNLNVPSPKSQIKMDNFNQCCISVQKNLENLIEKDQEQVQQNIQYHQTHMNDQVEFLQKNSISIDVNCEQFREKIQLFNRDRDQIIEKMQNIIIKFDKILSQNISQNIQDDEFQDAQYYGIINLMEEAIIIIKEMRIGLHNFISAIEQENGVDIQIIQKLLEKLKSNLMVFSYFEDVFKKTIQQNKEFAETIKKLQKKKSDLYSQLQELQQSKKQIQLLFNDLVLKLSEQDKQFNNIVRENPSNNAGILNLYNCCDRFNDQMMQAIQNLSHIICTLFPIENQQASIQLNQEILDKMSSFINSIKNEEQNIDTDSQEQQWERSLALFDQIYPNINNNSLIHKYIKRSLECILDMKRQVYENRKSVKEQIRRINGAQK